MPTPTVSPCIMVKKGDTLEMSLGQTLSETSGLSCSTVTFECETAIEISSPDGGTRIERFVKGDSVAGIVRRHLIATVLGPVEWYEVECEDGSLLHDVPSGIVTLGNMSSVSGSPSRKHTVKKSPVVGRSDATCASVWDKDRPFWIDAG